MLPLTLTRRLLLLIFLFAVISITTWHQFVSERTSTNYAVSTKPKPQPGTATAVQGPRPLSSEATVKEDKMVLSPIIKKPKPKPTGTIHRDFAKFAAPEEDFASRLSDAEQKLLSSLTVESTRAKKLEQLYDMDGDRAWRNYIANLDDDAVAPFTRFAQDYIYKHQHPSNCKNKKFLVMNHFNDKNGLGTVIHGIGFILNLAIREDRVLIYNLNEDKAPGRHFVEENCLGDGRRSLDCIYEPLTSCSFDDVTRDNSMTVDAYWNPPAEIATKSGTIPPFLGALLRKTYPDMKPNAMKYWWRSEAAGYVMRMNKAATGRMKELRMDVEMHKGFTRDPESGEVNELEVPFPLPQPSFSMHVRHGDKGIEMELIQFADYLERAEWYAAENPLTAQKYAFISTEDDAVFDEAKNISTLMKTSTTSNSNWVFYHSKIPRINGGPKEQLEAFGNRTEMTIKWMQQLMMAVECDTIVGTRGSGWNRMIDELRCVWVDCRKPYLEVGVPIDWIHYNY